MLADGVIDAVYQATAGSPRRSPCSRRAHRRWARRRSLASTRRAAAGGVIDGAPVLPASAHPYLLPVVAGVYALGSLCSTFSTRLAYITSGERESPAGEGGAPCDVESRTAALTRYDDRRDCSAVHAQPGKHRQPARRSASPQTATSIRPRAARHTWSMSGALPGRADPRAQRRRRSPARPPWRTGQVVGADATKST